MFQSFYAVKESVILKTCNAIDIVRKHARGRNNSEIVYPLLNSEAASNVLLGGVFRPII